MRYMVASALAFSVMSALVKLAGQRLPSQEIVFARAIVALVLSYALLRRAGVPLLGTNRPLLVLRGVFGFCGLSCVFYSVSHLPLAEATVIQYLHPVFTAILAATFLGEAVGRRLGLSMALSFAGVLLVTRPTALLGLASAGLDPFATGVAVAGAFFSACAYVVVRRLSASEHALVIVFYFPLVTVPATLPTLSAGAVWPQGFEWALLLGVGVMAQVGQVALTRGMTLEPAARATALSYLQVVFAAVLGAVIFRDLPDVWTLLGSLLILLGATATSRS